MHTWLRAFSLPLILVLSSCGGGGGGGGGSTSTPPTANFSFACTDLACSFTNLSTSQDTNDSIIAYQWTFGDGSAVDTTLSPTHTYAAASTYTVSLLAIDSKGLRGTATRSVTVSTPATPASPHASFTASCLALDCTFTDTSTFDAGSVFQSRNWDFGDTVTLAATNPALHTYALNPVTTYTVRLTVTDTTGKTSTAAQTIVVAPPVTTLGCITNNCALNLTQAARVTVTLVNHSCSARRNTVEFTAPVMQTVFSDACYDTLGTAVQIGGGTLFPAGTSLQLSVLSGTLPNSTIAFSPNLRISGDFAQGWTLVFDDGYGGPGEPDFNDIVLLVKATP